MAIQAERLPLTHLGSQRGKGSPTQDQLFVEYWVGPYHCTWQVVADRADVNIALPSEFIDLLPSPLARDILVAVGESVNRLELTSWEIDSANSRTFVYSFSDLLETMGMERSASNYEALKEAALGLGRLRITAQHAWKEKGKWQHKSVFGLFDSVEVFGPDHSPLGWSVKLQLSVEYARALARDSRLLETDTWRALQSDAARALYRLLEAERHQRDRRGEKTLAVPLQFLRDRLPIAAGKAVHAKRVLDRAIDDLVAVGYLAPIAATDRYRGARAEELERFPARWGPRTKKESVKFTILRADTPTKRPKLSDEEKRQLLEKATAGTRHPGDASDLANAVADVQRTVGDPGNVGLYTGLCKVLPDESLHRILATIRADRPVSPRATFVSQAKAELDRLNIPLPFQRGELQRTLARLL